MVGIPKIIFVIYVRPGTGGGGGGYGPTRILHGKPFADHLANKPHVIRFVREMET